MTQRQQKHARILQTAFEVWGESQFVNTSLASIAERLELSKTALYRYFAGKDELIAGMQRQFGLDYCAAAAAQMPDDDDIRLERVVGGVSHTMLTFLRGEPAYLTFFTEYLLRRSIMEDACLLDVLPVEMRATVERQTDQLRRALKHELGHEAEHRCDQMLQYAFLAAIYWSALYYMTPEMRPRRRVERNGSQQFEGHARLVSEVVLHGVAGGLAAEIGNLAAVEETAWRNPGTVLTEDRVLAAVEAVVAGFGFGEATIERIADHLGISKSSLYFYFKNKNEMFSELLARENELFLSEYRGVRDSFTQPTEQLYAYLVLQTAFFAHNPGVFKVVNWLWSQQLETVELPEDRVVSIGAEFTYLQDEISAGRLRAGEDGRLGILVFFHIAGVMLFAQHLQDGALDRESLTASARTLFLLGTHGLRAGMHPREDPEQETISSDTISSEKGA